MPRSLLLFIYSSSRFRSGTRPCRCSCSAVPRDLLFIRGPAGGGHACPRGSVPLFLFRFSAVFIIYSRGHWQWPCMPWRVHAIVPVPPFRGIYYLFTGRWQIRNEYEQIHIFPRSRSHAYLLFVHFRKRNRNEVRKCCSTHQNFYVQGNSS